MAATAAGVAPPPVPDLTDLVPLRTSAISSWRGRWRDMDVVVRVGVARLRTPRARREVEAMILRLRSLAPSPTLVPLLHSGISSGRAWWLTPFVPGGSLSGKRPSRPEDVLRAGVDVASALGLLHAGGTIHGHIAPSNLLLGGQGRILLDCPPVIALGETDQRSTGTAPHVPPEVLEGRPWTPSGDLWALGSTLYALLEGRPPFERERQRGVADLLLAMTLGHQVSFHRAGTSEGLQRALQRVLDADPERRPSAAAFGSALVVAAGTTSLGDRLDTVPPAPLARPPLTGMADAGGNARGERPLGSAYLLVEPIGRGAMGQVWRAVRRVDRTELAVKVLRSDLADDPEHVGRFLRERNALLSVMHPNVVRVHDLVVEGSVLAIVMDLVQGRDLRALLVSRGNLSPAEVGRMVSAIASGLAAVHAAGIVHRDLKPENVLVPDDPGAQVRLTDFGVARFLEGTTFTRGTQLIGTPDYLAPELSTGRSPTPPGDIYALGVLAYELVSGRRPFRGGSPTAILRAHLEEVPVAPAGLDPQLWQLVADSLAKDPAQRPTADEVVVRVAEILPSLAAQPLPRTDAPAPPGAEEPYRPAAALAPWVSAGPEREEPAASAGTAGPDARAMEPLADRARAEPGPSLDRPEEGPSMVPLVAPGLPVGAERLTTHIGRVLPEAPVEAPPARRRWPIVLGVAGLAVLATIVGFLTAGRDEQAAAPPSSLITTTTGPPAPKFVSLPIGVQPRTKGGAAVLRIPEVVVGARFRLTKEVLLSITRSDSKPELKDAIAHVPTRVGQKSGPPTRGLVLLPSDLDHDHAIETVTVRGLPKGSCVRLLLEYRGIRPTVADAHVNTFATTCTRIDK